MVDPWLGETACDPCFGQLDGDDALPDLAVGRLPVKTEAELEQLVRKLIAYDTAPAGGLWRGKAVFVADNADGAGDFAAFAELSVAEQPAGITVERVYFQPSLDARPVTGGSIADALQARAQTLAALSQGAGLVNYVGHSHAWQWAVTDPAVTPSYLLGLYDVDALANGDRLPIVLEMTCLTSAFQQPAYRAGRPSTSAWCSTPPAARSPPGGRRGSVSRTATMPSSAASTGHCGVSRQGRPCWVS